MISRAGRITADELLAMKDVGRCELVRGEIRGMSPVGSEHGRIAGHIFARLYNHVSRLNLGQTFAAETGFRIASTPDTVRVPDAAFVSHQRLEPLEETSGYLPIAPDLVVKVISPSDRFSEVEEKAAEWLEAGSLVVLVADPRTSTLRVYRDAHQIEILHADDTFDAGTAVAGWTLSVRDALGLK